MAHHELTQIQLEAIRLSCEVLRESIGNCHYSMLTDTQVKNLSKPLSEWNAHLDLPSQSLERTATKEAWPAKDILQLTSNIKSSIKAVLERNIFLSFDHTVQNIIGEILPSLIVIEEHLGANLRREIRSRIYGLYVIINIVTQLQHPPLMLAEEVLKGGAKVIQLRAKDSNKQLISRLSRAMNDLCESNDALFLVNDHADIAASSNSHGVHLGQDDLSIESARKLLNPLQIIGKSNHTFEEVMESHDEGADYIAVGAMYPTTSKKQPNVGGPPLLKRVADRIDLPIVAIGGITPDRIKEVILAGANCICVINPINTAERPLEMSKFMVSKILQAGGQA